MTVPERIIDLVEALGPLWWPLAGVAISVMLIKNADRLQRVFARLKKFSGFGVSFELSETGARATRQEVEDAFSEMRRQLQREMEMQTTARRIADKWHLMMREYVLPAVESSRAGGDVRGTIHVPDPLFENALYQLVDDYPRGGPKGRSISTRRGLAGGAWRLNRSRTVDDPAQEEDLIGRWGMTMPEADDTRARGKSSFCAVLLRDEGNTPIAVVYLDSEAPHAFGRTEEEKNSFHRTVVDAANRTHLDRSVADLMSEILLRGPRIKIGV